MADEHDYTQMWSGVYTPPRVSGEDRGVYLLDDESSVGATYDDSACVRRETHPRSRLGGQRYPGPYGGGRVSDRVGPSLAERRAALWRDGEGFSAAPEDRRRYAQGSRELGHPGPRGMVTSGREGRQAVDDVVWDNRPPHYADDTPNKYAHLYVDPVARGPALFSKDATYPGFRQVDRFAGAGITPAAPAIGTIAGVETLKVVLFVIVAILIAMCCLQQLVSGVEKRIRREVECDFREALLARSS